MQLMPHFLLDGKLERITRYERKEIDFLTNTNMQNTQFRFNVGDTVFVIDGTIVDFTDRALVLAEKHEYKKLPIVKAIVREQHHHSDDERYTFSSKNTLWDCYPGCRVFATLEQAQEGMPQFVANQILELESIREEMEEEELEVS